MTLPSDIPEAVAERAAILMDTHRNVSDDLEYTARIIMAVEGDHQRPERRGLTPHQRNALSFIEGYIAESGCSPSINDVREHFGLASKSAAHRVVGELVARGAITTLPRKARSINIVARG